MKLFISNLALAGFLLCCLCVPAPLKGENKDRIPTPYEKRVERYTSAWNKLIPQYVKTQFAGSIGLVSVGTGWSYCKNRLETDILFGIVPKYQDSRSKLTFTVREQYTPWNLPIRETDWSIQPLTCGLFINTLVDGRFWNSEPGGKYPSNYYNFSSKIRFNIFLGQQVTYNLALTKSLHRSVSFYYQISTCDLYLVSAWNNSYLKPTDYLSLAFGLKFQIL